MDRMIDATVRDGSIFASLIAARKFYLSRRSRCLESYKLANTAGSPSSSSSSAFLLLLVTQFLELARAQPYPPHLHHHHHHHPKALTTSAQLADSHPPTSPASKSPLAAPLRRRLLTLANHQKESALCPRPPGGLVHVESPAMFSTARVATRVAQATSRLGASSCRGASKRFLTRARPLTGKRKQQQAKHTHDRPRLGRAGVCVHGGGGAGGLGGGGSRGCASAATATRPAGACGLCPSPRVPRVCPPPPPPLCSAPPPRVYRRRAASCSAALRPHDGLPPVLQRRSRAWTTRMRSCSGTSCRKRSAW